MSNIKKGDRSSSPPAATRARRAKCSRCSPRKTARWSPGVNVVKRHQRQTQTQQGGIVNKEAPIHLSNLAHVDPKSGKATRIGFKTLNDGRKVRFAKKSGEVIDV